LLEELAPPPLHPDQRFAHLHLSLLPVHLLPQPTLRILSFLLLILFASSCHWSDHCFFDVSGNWFEPRLPSFTSTHLHNQTSNQTGDGRISNGTIEDMAAGDLAVYASALNNTATALASTFAEDVKRRVGRTEWTGIGVEWLRSLLGRREWRVPCVDVYIRL